MNIKEQENQLSFGLNIRILLNVLLYVGLVAFVVYQLYLAGRTSSVPIVSGVVVPRLKVDNFESLTSSLKSTKPGLEVPPTTRVEPFD